MKKIKLILILFSILFSGLSGMEEKNNFVVRSINAPATLIDAQNKYENTYKKIIVLPYIIIDTYPDQKQDGSDQAQDGKEVFILLGEEEIIKDGQKILEWKGFLDIIYHTSLKNDEIIKMALAEQKNLPTEKASKENFINSLIYYAQQEQLNIISKMLHRRTLGMFINSFDEGKGSVFFQKKLTEECVKLTDKNKQGNELIVYFIKVNFIDFSTFKECQNQLINKKNVHPDYSINKNFQWFRINTILEAEKPIEGLSMLLQKILRTQKMREVIPLLPNIEYHKE